MYVLMRDTEGKQKEASKVRRPYKQQSTNNKAVYVYCANLDLPGLSFQVFVLLSRQVEHLYM